MTMPLPAFAMSSALRHAKLGWLALAALIASVGGWAALADISGAVIAHGTVVVEANVKTVQHPTGGVVAEIRVREGELVDAGQVLIRLDATQLRATYTIASIALDELTARKARLESERDAISEIAFPPDPLARAGEPGVRARMESEQRALEVRSRSSEGRKAQLRERISQLNNSIEGYEVRRKAKIKELEFIARELSGARDLWRKGLIPISKLTALEREETRLEGERAAYQPQRRDQGEDLRNGAADPPGRPRSPQRHCARVARSRRQDRRAPGARDGSRRSAAPRRYPCTARGSRASALGA